MSNCIRNLQKTAGKVYNYHNLGVGIFPEGEEKTPHGSGERYNFDRMYMFVSNYDFTHKNILDIGCNSGWFCIQGKLLGADKVLGLDYRHTGIMGEAIKYAKAVEKRLKFGIIFEDANVEKVNWDKLMKKHKIGSFDAVFLLSVLHHIHDKSGLITELYDRTSEVIFYEDHEFWNDMKDKKGNSLKLTGDGYRYGWNEDLSWQRKIALEDFEEIVIKSYFDSWRKDALLLERFSKISFLGFSEKRRPVIALWK